MNSFDEIQFKKLLKQIPNIRSFICQLLVNSIGMKFGTLLIKVQDHKVIRVEVNPSFDVSKDAEIKRFEGFNITDKVLN